MNTGLLDLGVTRTYSSADQSYFGGGAGPFGRGWHHNWEGWLSCNGEWCTVSRGLEQGLQFTQGGTALSIDGTETWQLYPASTSLQGGPDNTSLLVRRPGGEWMLFSADGSELHFATVCDTCASPGDDPYCADATVGGKARLTKVVNGLGNSVSLTYDRQAGLVLGLSDDLGHSLQLIGAQGCTDRHATSLAYDGVAVATYSYLDEDLEAAIDADGALLRSYGYDPLNGRLLQVLNQAGDAIASFSYDNYARATGIIDSSSSVLIDYSDPSSPQVHEYFGNTSSASVRTLGDGGAVTSISDGCACGPARTFRWSNRQLECSADTAGHVAWQSFDDQQRLTYRGEFYSSQGCPATAPSYLDPAQSRQEWMAYGISKPIAQGVSLPLYALTTRSRRSVSGNQYVETFNYDPTPQSIDPVGYACQQSPMPVAGVRCRHIESGYTNSSTGALVLVRYATFYSFDARGRLVRTIGPINLDTPSPNDVTPLEVRTYWPDTDGLSRRGRLHQTLRYPT